MYSLFQRYYPYFALILLSALFIIWSFYWFAQKADHEAMMFSRLANIGFEDNAEPEIHGFPSRYEYRFERLTLKIKGAEFRSGKTRIMSYPQNPDRIIVKFDDPIMIIHPRAHFSVSADPLIASLVFDVSDHIANFILKGENARIQQQKSYEEYSKTFKEWLFAYDPSQEDPFALRLNASDAQIIKADRFAEISEIFENTYLQ